MARKWTIIEGDDDSGSTMGGCVLIIIVLGLIGWCNSSDENEAPAKTPATEAVAPGNTEGAGKNK